MRVNVDTQIELFIKRGRRGVCRTQSSCGLRHLAFWVKDVPETVSELSEKGIDCEPIRYDSITGDKIAFFHNPEGLLKEIYE